MTAVHHGVVDRMVDPLKTPSIHSSAFSVQPTRWYNNDVNYRTHGRRQSKHKPYPINARRPGQAAQCGEGAAPRTAWTTGTIPRSATKPTDRTEASSFRTKAPSRTHRCANKAPRTEGPRPARCATTHAPSPASAGSCSTGRSTDGA
jgi:hypothetical protein